ncbi:MAG: serine/threonine protein phosphatase [Bacteroidetes bacterium]|nr:serine/threonine protein phosphatase [Bacteroidota bacterium]
MKRIIAIGDIHGCKKTLDKMLFQQLQITKEDVIYLLGDLIDRGPDSRGVIDTILTLEKEGFTILTVLGNHEEMMLQSVLDATSHQIWIRNGGAETLKSFESSDFTELPMEYKLFFYRAKFFIETDTNIFVHAGLNFTNENLFEDQDAMLWVRNYHDYQPALKNKILVHGHTPLPLRFIKNQRGNCINIDGGCVFTNWPTLGNLVAVILPDREYIFVPNVEK